MDAPETTPSLAARCALWCLAFALLSMVTLSARADEEVDAQRHFERAVTLYQERAYDEALVEFQRAFELSPRYEVLFNIAQVHYQLNEYAEALRTFERYLSEGGGQIPNERRAFVQHELSELRERVGTLSVVTDVPGASVLLDDVELGVTPLSGLTVSIGRHSLRVEHAGYPALVRRLQVTSGETLRVELAFAPLANGKAGQAHAAGELPDVARARRRRSALWTLGTLSVALAAGAGASLGLAYRSDHDLDHELEQLPPDRAAVEHDRTQVRRAALASDVLGAGALAAAAGFVVTLVATKARASDADKSPAKAQRKLTARLELAPTMLRLRGSF
jgi:tetratricopeptide (TPR) repeat protein